jgi:hypothetical protein
VVNLSMSIWVISLDGLQMVRRERGRGLVVLLV